MTVGFNFSLGFGKGTTPTDFDPTKYDPILDENGKIIGYKPKKDKVEETSYLKEENQGDTVQISSSTSPKTEEQTKVDKTCKNVQNEFDKVTNEINIDDVAEADKELMAETEKTIKQLENNPFITSFKAGLMAQSVFKSIDDIQQNANNTVTVEEDIKKDAKEKDTTVTGINKDFGFLLTSAYKTFGAVDAEIEETEEDMDLVG